MAKENERQNFYERVKGFGPKNKKILLDYYDSIKDLPRFNLKTCEEYFKLIEEEHDSKKIGIMKRKIVEGNLYRILNLVINVFSSEMNIKSSIDDIIQIANLSLIEVIDSYNYNKTGKTIFTICTWEFAYKEICRYQYFLNSPFKKPNNVNLRKFIELSNEGYTKEKIKFILGIDEKSIEELAEREQFLLEHFILNDSLGDINLVDERLYYEQMLNIVMSSLTKREKEVLMLHYQDDVTLRRIAKIYGVSYQRIGKISKKVLEKTKTKGDKLWEK